MSEQQGNWPIIELIVEYGLPESAWSDAVPDKLYEALSEQFPDRKKRSMFTHNLRFEPGKVDQSHQDFDRHQFFTKDGRMLVQANRGLLSVNHVRPYSAWEAFVPMIQVAEEAYKRSVGSELGSISLQYINRIEFTEPSVDLEKEFTFRPQFEGRFIQCGCIAVQPWGEDGSTLTRKMDAVPAPSNQLVVVLILAAKKPAVGWTETQHWLADAHEELKKLFKNSISDSLFTRFKGGQ